MEALIDLMLRFTTDYMMFDNSKFESYYRTLKSGFSWYRNKIEMQLKQAKVEEEHQLCYVKDITRDTEEAFQKVEKLEAHLKHIDNFISAIENFNEIRKGFVYDDVED
jgi:hypothetical protein